MRSQNWEAFSSGKQAISLYLLEFWVHALDKIVHGGEWQCQWTERQRKGRGSYHHHTRNVPPGHAQCPTFAMSQCPHCPPVCSVASSRAANTSRICVKLRIYALDREDRQLAKAAPFLKKVGVPPCLKRKLAASPRFSTDWLPTWTQRDKRRRTLSMNWRNI